MAYREKKAVDSETRGPNEIMWRPYEGGGRVRNMRDHRKPRL